MHSFTILQDCILSLLRSDFLSWIPNVITFVLLFIINFIDFPIRVFSFSYIFLFSAKSYMQFLLNLYFGLRLLKIYNKIHKHSDLLSIFATTEWKFTNERWNELLKKLTAEDRQLFFCDMKELVWDTFFKKYPLGIRTYILKDPIETIPQARIKWRRYLLFYL